MERFQISQNYHSESEWGTLGGQFSGGGAEREIRRQPLCQIERKRKIGFFNIPARFTIAIMIFLGLVITYAKRRSFLALKHTGEYSYEIKRESDSNYHIGYAISQILGGLLAFVYPANKVFGISIVGSSLFSLSVPFIMEQTDGRAMFWMYLLQGLIEGVSYCSFIGILRFWAPYMERTAFVTFALSGPIVGHIVSELLTDLLIKDLGYQSTFYIYGTLGIIWYLFWNWLCFESPRKHPTISQHELEYIVQSLEESEAPSPKRTSCWEILRSMPVYANIVGSVSYFCTSLILVMYMTLFISNKFSSSLMNPISNLVLAIILPVSGILADYLRKNNILSTTNVRKLFYCGGFGIATILMIYILKFTTVSSLMLGLACYMYYIGIGSSAVSVNYLDIAPHYATILMGVSETIALLAYLGFNKYYDNISLETWTTIFAITVYVNVIGCFFYGMFASGKLQSWAKPKAENGRVTYAERANNDPMVQQTHHICKI